ncbi:MAG: hypothetical protein K2O04_01765 [Clostridiales bacterium]|nr:hypothetical protein [Clostridiales bacterium]
MNFVRRHKIGIFVIFFAVLLLFTAVFCVSFAEWVNPNVSVVEDLDGNVGLFYVDASGLTAYDNGIVARQSGGSSKSRTYKNYVCVYKSTDNIDAAFVNFSLNLKSGDPDAVVTGFKVERSLADENGIPTGAKTTLSVYNFGGNKPIEQLFETDYNNNPYVKLEFEPGAGQYYALDVTIETSAEVSFDFKAVATLYDKHECNEPDTYFFGYGNWMRSLTAKMTVTKAEIIGYDDGGHYKEDVDCSIDVVLTAGTEFKMMKSNSTGDGIAIYYRPTDDAGTNVYSDYTQVMTTGNIMITASGLYRVRFYGTTWWQMDNPSNGSYGYRCANIEVTMLRAISDELTETSVPGIYVVGVFNDDKTCEEYKLTDSYANVEGFLALDYSGFKSIRRGDIFRVVELDGNGVRTELARSSLVEPRNDNDKNFLFDTFTNKAYSRYDSYRFVVDSATNEIVPNTGMTVGYRRIIPNHDVLASVENAVMGFRSETGLQSYNDGVKTLYYADIPYDEQIDGKPAGDIVSVTVLGIGGSSYDINWLSGAFTQLDGGYSYRITATGIPTIAQNGFVGSDCNNWVGNIRQGRSGDAHSFALDNAGYLIVNADGNTISNLARTGGGDYPYSAEIEKTATGAQSFAVLVNGVAMPRSSYGGDEIPRITKTPIMPFAFGTIGSEKALGTYFFYVGNAKMNVEYLSQPVSAEVVSGVPWDDSWQEGYYAVGMFSRWKAYPEYLLTPSDTVKTDIVFTHDKIITTVDVQNESDIQKADEYKIVYAYKNGSGTTAFVWFGKANPNDPDTAYLYNGGVNATSSITTLTFSMKCTFGNVITTNDDNFYAVGEFSDGKAYDIFKLRPDESGYFAVASQYFGAGDMFKIRRNGVDYGIAPTADNPGGYVTAAEGKIYFDAYKLITENETAQTVLDNSYYNIGVTGGCVADDRIRVFFTYHIAVAPHVWAWGNKEDGQQVDYAVGVQYNTARDDSEVIMKKIAPDIWGIELIKGRNGIVMLTGYMFWDSGYHTLTGDLTDIPDWGGCRSHGW